MELLFPLLLVALLIPMFLGVRRQKREAQKVADMQETVKVGDRVITTSGLYGTVVEVDETSVDLEIAEDVVTTWLRQAIREVRVDDELPEDDAEAADTADETTPAATPHAEAETTVVEETSDQTETRLTKD